MKTLHAFSAPRAALLAIALAATTWCLGCGHSGPDEKAQSMVADPYEARANALFARARALEPIVTAQLKTLSPAVGTRTFEMRMKLKPRASLLRKLRERHAANPSAPIEDIAIEDVLRYTILAKDEPPGTYVDTFQRMVSLLTTTGHSIVVVNNYWPGGDYYSGVDSVLRSEDGFLWELQLHTPQSIISRESNDNDYREFKDPKTSLERKRALFDRMASKWEGVLAPQGVLPAIGHAKEKVVSHPRP